MDKIVLKSPNWKTPQFALKSQYCKALPSNYQTEEFILHKGQKVQPLRPSPTQHILENENRPPGKLSDYVNKNSLSQSARELACTPSKFGGFDAILQQSQYNYLHEPSSPSQQLSDKEHLLQSPKSPHTTKQLQKQPLMARIHHDLNSPSANVRLRAIRALKSPNKSTYTQFDIPHIEQNIITAEERRIPPVQRSLQELMNEIIVYVEVRTGEDNRSDGVKKVISALGARVNNKLLRDTTHVIFKDGLLSTYKKAKNWNIPVVSILWIEACKNQKKICNPKDYPISNIDRYENPELYNKMKRQKSMQPDSECNKRVRVKCSTPGSSKKTTPLIVASTPQSSRSQKTDDNQYTNKLSTSASHLEKTKSFQQNPIGVVSHCDSPATQLLAKIDSNSFTPIASHKQHMNSIATALVAEHYDAVSQCLTDVTTPKMMDSKKIINFNTEENTPISTPVTSVKRISHRRRSAMQSTIDMATSYIGVMAEDSLSNNNTTIMTRRRRSMSNTQMSANHTLYKEVMDKNVHTILEEDMAISNCTNKNTSVLSDFEETNKTPNPRCTILALKSMEMCTPESVVQDKSVDIKNNHRRSLYTPKIIEESVTTADQQLNDFKNNASNNNFSNLHNTNSNSNILDDDPLVESSKEKNALEVNDEMKIGKTIFNSTFLPGRRKTMFDVSMDIITHRMYNINQSSSRRSSMALHQSKINTKAPTKEINLNTSTSKTENMNEIPVFDRDDNIGNLDSNHYHKDTVATKGNCNENDGTIQPLSKKKRKLFVPNEESFTLLTPPALKKICSSTTPLITPSSSYKRRKTLVPLLQPKSDSNLTVSKHLKGHSRRRSTLDFEISAAVHNERNDSTTLPSNLLSKPATEIKKTIDDNTITVNNRKIVAAPSQQQEKRTVGLLVYTNMHKEQIEVIREAIEHLGGLTLQKNVTDNTTHVVSLEPRRTLNMLRALVRGLWLLSYTWVLDSLQAGKWLYEEQYELRDFSRAVQICRAERQAFGNMYRCELFRHVGAFYISSKCGHISKEDLIELIKLSGGTVVEQHKRAKYVLGNVHRSKLDDKIYITPLWILDSITQMQLQRCQKYIWNNNVSSAADNSHSPQLQRSIQKTIC